MMSKVFPDSDIDLQYNPLERTAKEVELWSHHNANKLHQQCLLGRAMRIVDEGWPAVAAYYISLLRVMCGFGEAAAESTLLKPEANKGDNNSQDCPMQPA